MTPRSLPHIIYLDQNKWIELLRAEKSPSDYPRQFALLQKWIAKTQEAEILFPLSATNIYETFKINDPERREHLALLQAKLSGGIVFRAPPGRVEPELSNFLCDTYRLPPVQWPAFWFLSDLFYEAFPEAGVTYSDELIGRIRQSPGVFLRDYLSKTPEDSRISAVKAWSAMSETLRAQIELRREQHKDLPLPVRRRIYSFLIFKDEVEKLAKLAENYGVSWNSMSDIGPSVTRRIVEEMPIYYAERELVLRLEAQARSISENDMRDVHAYSAAACYADVIVGENQFVNLTRQAGLDGKYNTRLETDILTLAD